MTFNTSAVAVCCRRASSRSPARFIELARELSNPCLEGRGRLFHAQLPRCHYHRPASTFTRAVNTGLPATAISDSTRTSRPCVTSVLIALGRPADRARPRLQIPLGRHPRVDLLHLFETGVAHDGGSGRGPGLGRAQAVQEYLHRPARPAFWPIERWARRARSRAPVLGVARDRSGYRPGDQECSATTT